MAGTAQIKIPDGAPRRAYLRAYIVACVRDNVLSFSDLATGEGVQKILQTASQDIRLVGADLLKDTVRAGGALLGRWLGSRKG
jgi:hypothetical protein